MGRPGRTIGRIRESGAAGDAAGAPRRKPLPLAVTLAMLALAGTGPGPVHAAQPLPSGTLPVPAAAWATAGQAARSVAGRTMTIDQSSARAILNWQSFNIAPDSAVRFNHLTGATGSTLNRIFDASPSVIQGQLSANGQVYLINQNGIIFDRGAQVNVGSLVASTLNISDELYLNGILSNLTPATTPVFTVFGNGQPTGVVRVEPGAEIRTEREGRVMLLAPQVSNGGVIATPEGQTILAAGEKVYLAASTSPALRGLLVEVDNGGSATNLDVGSIVADRGNATIVGLAVNQMGRVSATTTVNANGSVRLLARDSVAGVIQDGINVPRGTRTGTAVLGPGSSTTVQPELASTTTSFDEQTFNPSSVEIIGRSVRVQESAAVRAPGGTITVTAQAGLEFQPSQSDPVAGARIYLAPGSTIDASGTRDVPVPIERNVVEVELRGDELKDSPLQRASFLRGKTVLVDTRKDPATPLANVSGFTGRVPRTVAERTAGGGSVTLRSEGDIILREGSSVDVSGGSIRYQDGYLRTTKLVSEGRIYDIGSAPADRIYDGFADEFIKDYGRWGIVETFRAIERGEFTPGYAEGRNAGTLTLDAHGVVLGGILRGGAIAGPYQREIAQAPLGGRLVLGDAAPTSTPVDHRLAGIDFRAGAGAVPAALDFSSPLQTGTVVLGSDLFSDGGFTRAELFANGVVNVPAGVDIVLAAGGALAISAREIAVAGSITAPSGSIALATAATDDSRPEPERYSVTLAPGARLDARGLWTNDFREINPEPTGPIATKGGTVSIKSTYDAVLGEGSVIDVSGGGYVQAGGKLKGGDAGSITIESGLVRPDAVEEIGEVRLGGELRGYGIGKGGALTLSAPQIVIANDAQTPPTGLAFQPDFFRRGGFKDFTLRALGSVTVAANTEVAPRQESLVVDADFRYRPSGADVQAFAQREELPVEQRAPQKLALNARSTNVGTLEIGAGASLQVDLGGEIRLDAGRQLTVRGAVDAPGGRITLTLPEATEADGFAPDQSILLASGSRLSAATDVARAGRVVMNDRGLRSGEVAGGGSVTMTAARGYIVAEPGSSIDVSGRTDVVDLPEDALGGVVYRATEVTSDGGSISLAAREGVAFAGMLKGAAGVKQVADDRGSARGGSLAVAVDYQNPLLGFPANPRIVRLTAGATGTGIVNGLAEIAADIVAAGGFDELALTSRDAIEVAGAVDLRLKRAMVLDAPVVRGIAGATGDPSDGRLEAAFVGLGNRDPQRQAAAQPGSGGAGRLALHGKLIELEGNVALQGFQSAGFTASEAVRVKGMVDDGAGTAKGALVAGGDLTFAAPQIHPATFTDFTIERTGGKVSFERSGTDTPVLSAAGRIEVRAAGIDQNGVIKAPFGEIVLNGTDSVTLGPDSITSVSGEGQVIPFGRTQLSGQTFVYGLSASRVVPLDEAPQKSVRVQGRNVEVMSGARIDLSGGGDLYAYEWVPGPGGSRDVLSAANAAGSFAIVKGHAGEFAPHDPQYAAGVTGLKAGDRVYLSGTDDLPAGVYTLLPPRYALLPGGFLVTPKAGTTDMLPSRAQDLASGARLVAGHRVAATADGSLVRDARSTGYLVKSGALVREDAEYQEVYASTFFASAPGRRPGDAGRLTVAATDAFAFNGKLAAAAAPGGRGAEVDITATRLAVVGEGGAPLGTDDYVRLSADSLTNLGAASLLLGGTRRETSEGTELLVAAEEVVLATTASHPLRAPELIVAANDRVTVKAGTVAEGKGPAGAAGKLIVGFGIADSNGNGTINGDDVNRGDVNGDGRIDALDSISGDGALLRLAGGPQASLERRNVARLQGTLAIEGAEQGGRPAALVKADGSMLLDATFETDLSGSIELGARASLALGAARVHLGAPAAAVEGLLLSNERLQALGRPQELVIRSYSTVDVHGSVSLGEASGAERIRSLVIDAAGLGGYGGDSARASIHADSVTLANPDGRPFSAAPGLALGSKAFEIHAENVELGAGTFELRGFSGTTLTGGRELFAAATGELRTDGSLALEATRITAGSGVNYAMQLTGAGTRFTTALPPEPALDLAAAQLGGRITVSAPTIEHGGNFTLPSGRLSLSATAAAGPDGAGSVTLVPGARIDAAGRSETYFDLPVPTPGGQVALTAAFGNISLAAGTVIDVAGADGADGGRLSISAPNGVLVAGTQVMLKGGANAASPLPRQGEFALDVGTLDDFAGLNRLLNPVLDASGRLRAGGFTESRDIRVRHGDVDIGTAEQPDVQVVAHRFQLAADDGDVNLHGRIDATGAKGGEVALFAARGASAGAGDVTVHAGAQIAAAGTEAVAEAFGTRGEGGRVLLGSAADGAAVSVAGGALIDVSGAGAARDGQVLLRARRNAAGNDLPVTLLGEVLGAREVIAEGYKIYTTTAISGAGADSASNLNVSATGTAFTEAQNFVNNTRANASGVRSRLSASAAAVFHLRPGIEVQSPGDLTVSVNEATTATNQTTPRLDLRGWNLGTWRFGSGTADAGFSQEPGVLTLRAAGNVSLNSSIGDGFTPPPSSATALNNRLMNEWNALTADNPATPNVREDSSFSIRIVAGADHGAADPLATRAGTAGDITLADHKLVRTGNGNIDIAAAGNLNLAGAGAVIYTAGVPGPSYADYTLPNNLLGVLALPATQRRPQFPEHGGDLGIRVGGAINAAPSEQLFTGWQQRQGALDANGGIDSSVAPAWWIRFDGTRQSGNSADARYLQGGFRQGVGALGGGDVTIVAGGDINNLAASTPTNGRLRGENGSVPDPARLAIQGGGDLQVESGGDIRSAQFFVDRGQARIVAAGEVGRKADRPVGTILALGDAQMHVAAGGNITLDGVVNPTVLTQGPRNNQRPNNFDNPVRPADHVFFTYTGDSSLDLVATGSIELANRVNAIQSAYSPASGQTDAQALFLPGQSEPKQLAVYPGRFSAAALTGDLTVSRSFSMFPAANGNLDLIAHGSIGLPVAVSMSDASLAALPSAVRPATGFGQFIAPLEQRFGSAVHSDPPVHQSDREPSRIYALTGDVTGGADGIGLPEQVRVIAGRDVRNLTLFGQNVHESDLTLIAAGRDVIYTQTPDAFGNPQPVNGSIQIGGPGRLEVIAGRDIDLSTGDGILTRGNLNNPLLPEGGATIMALAGAPAFATGARPQFDVESFLVDGRTSALPPIRLTRADVAAHVRRVTGDSSVTESSARERFNALPAEQQWSLLLDALFTALKETGRAATAQNAGYERGYQAIDALFPGGGYAGNINLFFSQIKTEQGGDIELLAPGGLVNAGLANPGSFSKGASVLGIVTVRGGSVRALVRDDFLVNQSRVFTLQGGDVLIWSSEGNIDAGKGAKTASATPPPLIKVDSQGNITLDTTQSVSGSGIGVLLAKEGIVPGDVDLIAPRGEVNAGDAGIRAAGNLNIAAVRVVGAENIQVGGRSQGVPTGESVSFAGALTGAAGLGAEGTRAAEQATRGSAAAAQSAQAPAFRPSFITVEILGIGPE